MTVPAALTFTITVAYAAIGNAAVYILLRRRGVPLQFIWSGTPGYLYGVCRRSTVPRSLTRFALSTNVAILLAIASGIWFAASQQ